MLHFGKVSSGHRCGVDGVRVRYRGGQKAVGIHGEAHHGLVVAQFEDGLWRAGFHAAHADARDPVAPAVDDAERAQGRHEIGVVGPRCVASEERAHGPGAGRSAHVVDAEAVGEHAHLHGGTAVVVLMGERVEHGFVHRIPRRSTMAAGGAETVGAARGRLLFRQILLKEQLDG